MQTPPGPPQGNPPSAASGVDKRTGSTLAYLVVWITGIIFLFVGKNDPDVKYHAAQSVVTFGGLTVLQVALDIVGGYVGVFTALAGLVGLAQFLCWLYCLYRAWTGGGARFQIPVIGGLVTPYAEQLANSVA